ncbi:MAG: carboxymuconolactone decarboxylase family protein [Thermoanaerobaculia bacterium]
MTQRIAAVDPDTATGKTKELFDTIKAANGRVANIMKTMGNSPAALSGYLALNGALAEGLLPAQLREQIALAIGEANRCEYCISAHTAIGKMAGLDESDVSAARQSKADDDKTEAALAFVHKLVVARGQISDDELANVRAAGYTDGEIVEMIAHVALNTFTNYFNLTARTVVDFPRVEM